MSLTIETGHAMQSPIQIGENKQAEEAGRVAQKNSQQTRPSQSKKTPRYDEYVGGADQPAESSAGIYELSKDEEGKPQITFESPDKKAADKGRPAVDDKKPEIMKCTVDKGRVEAEIKKLQEKQQKIQQQIRENADNPEKRAALQQLASLDAELKMKDNDAYKKQNATFTFNKVSE